MLAAVATDPGDDADQRTEYLWPCNVKNWLYWQDIQTQWQVGMSGATGLDYAGVCAALKVAHKLRGKKLQEAFEGIQAAERATLAVWAKQAAEREDKPT